MKCSSFQCCLGPFYILSKAMCYIFGYFRARHSRRRRQFVVPESVSSVDDKGHVIPPNHLAYLFLAEENIDFPVKVDALPSICPVISYKEPEDQVLFLQACGILVQTPEIHNMPRSSDVSDYDYEDPISSGYHPGNLDIVFPNDPPCLSENTPSSAEIMPASDMSMPDESRAVLAERSSNSVCPPSNISNKNKSVRFEFENEEHFATHHSSDNVENIENSEHHFESAPTPLKIEDGMQTPGTVFPANAKNLRNRNIFIKPHYFYPGLVDSIRHSKADTRGTRTPDTSKLFPKKDHCDLVNTDLKGMGEEAFNDSDSSSTEHSFVRNGVSGTTSGIVDAQCRGLFSTDSPRRMEGNGIPNSTKKYMEDQKVCWHATPFEERLDKAILEDGFIVRKTNEVMPLIFEE